MIQTEPTPIQFVEQATTHFDSAAWVAHMLTLEHVEPGDRLAYEPAFLTTIIDPTDQDSVKLHDVEQGARSLVAVPAHDDAERMVLPRGFVRDWGDLRPSILVTPETEEEIEAWTEIHEHRSIHALDNDATNIAERLGNGAIIVVLGSQVKAKVEQRVKEQNQQATDSAYNEWYAQHGHKYRHTGNGRGGMSSSAARSIVTQEWHGSLGGGSPQNPIRVGQISLH